MAKDQTSKLRIFVNFGPPSLLHLLFIKLHTLLALGAGEPRFGTPKSGLQSFDFEALL